MSPVKIEKVFFLSEERLFNLQSGVLKVHKKDLIQGPLLEENAASYSMLAGDFTPDEASCETKEKWKILDNEKRSPSTEDSHENWAGLEVTPKNLKNLKKNLKK